MSLHNILLHQNPEKHPSHHKITLQWCNSFPNATLSWDKLQVSCWQSHLDLREHRSAFAEKFSHRVCLTQRLWAASKWHIYSRNVTSVTMLCMCRPVTGTYHHYSLWALHLETVSAASGSQRSPGCQRNHLCRGEAGRGSHCVQSPSSLYSHCHECCAWGSQYPLFPTWKYSRNLFIKKALTYSWDALHIRKQSIFPNTKNLLPQKGFPWFLCPFFPSKQSASLQ